MGTGQWSGRIALSAGTDNQSNGHLIAKLTTTKWPPAAILIELAHQCDSRGLDFGLTWRRRDRNVEADALTNENFAGFDPLKRIQVEPSAMPFALLPRLLSMGYDFMRDLLETKASAKTERPRGRKRLREKGPW